MREKKKRSCKPSAYEKPLWPQQSHTETHFVQIMHECLCLPGLPAPNMHTQTHTESVPDSAE